MYVNINLQLQIHERSNQMKEFEKPELMELAISNTQSGGSDFNSVDHTWRTYTNGIPEDHTTYNPSNN